MQCASCQAELQNLPNAEQLGTEPFCPHGCVQDIDTVEMTIGLMLSDIQDRIRFDTQKGDLHSLNQIMKGLSELCDNLDASLPLVEE